jgi:mitochondrial fission protein ELM1
MRNSFLFVPEELYGNFIITGSDTRNNEVSVSCGASAVKRRRVSLLKYTYGSVINRLFGSRVDYLTRYSPANVCGAAWAFAPIATAINKKKAKIFFIRILSSCVKIEYKIVPKIWIKIEFGPEVL